MTYLNQPGSGSNGTNVSNSNATYGNQFNNVPAPTGTGTTLQYSNAHTVHGRATAVQWHYATVSSTAVAIWTSAVVPSSANSYTRLYLYMTAYPSVNTRIATMASGAAQAGSALVVIPAGNLRLFGSAGSNIGSTVGTIPLNQWVRCAYECTGISGSTGNLFAAFYSGPNLETNTPDTNGSVTVTGASIGGNVTDVRFGSSTAVTQTTAWDAWEADMAWSDTAPPGPLVRTQTGSISLGLAGDGADNKLVAKSAGATLNLATTAADAKVVPAIGSLGVGLALSAVAEPVEFEPPTGTRFYAIDGGSLVPMTFIPL